MSTAPVARYRTSPAVEREREIWTVADMATANRDAGFHWFEPATLRWFSSRILEGLVYRPGSRFVYFVSSERQGEEYPRLYTVRRFSLDRCNVETVGEFQAYRTAREARRAMRAAVAGEVAS
jgi:hypothetical protein